MKALQKPSSNLPKHDFIPFCIRHSPELNREACGLSAAPGEASDQFQVTGCDSPVDICAPDDLFGGKAASVGAVSDDEDLRF